MDSVTQVALGAAIGELILGQQTGRRALMWGAFCGLLPDLDVLYPFTDAVKAVTYHRSYSHSLLVLTGITPLLVWLILKCHPQTAVHRLKWHILVYLALVTHVLLDCFTVYGTQIFWPLKTPPVMWSTIFIIDPFYSVPLLSGVLVVLILSNKSSWVHFANVAGLLLSTIYLICTVGIKIYVTDIVHQSFERQDISYQKMLITPTPFNTLLWRVLAIDDTGYFEGFYSLFDNTKDVQVRHYYSDKSLLKGMANQWPVKRLQWFTHGFYSVKKDGNDIVIVDLRMGIEPFYVFQFKIGSVGNPHVKTINTTWIKSETHWYQLRWVWQRIWTVKPGISYRQDS